jgi:DNA-binding NarL/FixJ family response regulator
VDERITIVLADDHHIMRQGLRALLEREPDLAVVGEVADGAAALEALARLAPDVLILDLMMPSVNGLEVLRQAAKLGAGTRFVVLSMHSTGAYVVDALHSGASAYVLKEATASDLVRAVREVTAGRRYLSPPLSEHAIDAYTKRAQATSIKPHGVLTAREMEVLRLAAQGYSVQQIAAALSISPRTAETHRSHLMRKLDLHSQTDLVRYAIRERIVLE